ncbi:MAG: response regulator [Rhodospirillales bacterium]|nr:response regulator [Rhodospirillales bacterium]
MSSAPSKGLVIVVEDDATVRRMYTSSLKQLGYTVLAAESGEDGLALLSQHQARVVILDIDLPGISGIEVCRRSRSLATAKAPVIFITGNDTVDILQECIEAGGDDFIVKGGPMSALLERVNYWARGSSRKVSERQRRLILDKTGAMIEALEAKPEPKALATAAADPSQLVEHPDVLRVRDAFLSLKEKWPDLSDHSVKARIRRFGYLTGLVNAAAKSSLEMKVRFMDFLRASMMECGVAKENELATMFENWHQLYTNPNFSDACAAAEKDFADVSPD